MPTRKQRKRMEKERRHEYETVWVDADGNELEEPPDDVPSAPRERGRADKGGTATKATAKSPNAKNQRSRASARVPQPPSWRRAIRRGGVLGVVVIVFFYIATTKSAPGTRIAIALVWGVGYTALFIPFTYGLDRIAYRRWQRKTAERTTKR